MALTGLFVIVLIIIVIGAFLFRGLLAKRTLLELLVLSILIVLAGGFTLVASLIHSNDSYELMLGYILVTLGFFMGLFSFIFKDNK